MSITIIVNIMLPIDLQAMAYGDTIWYWSILSWVKTDMGDEAEDDHHCGGDVMVMVMVMMMIMMMMMMVNTIIVIINIIPLSLLPLPESPPSARKGLSYIDDT